MACASSLWADEVVLARGTCIPRAADLRHPRGGEAQGSLPDAFSPHHYQRSFELRLHLRVLQCIQRGAVFDGCCGLPVTGMFIYTCSLSATNYWTVRQNSQVPQVRNSLQHWIWSVHDHLVHHPSHHLPSPLLVHL